MSPSPLQLIDGRQLRARPGRLFVYSEPHYAVDGWGDVPPMLAARLAAAVLNGVERLAPRRRGYLVPVELDYEAWVAYPSIDACDGWPMADFPCGVQLAYYGRCGDEIPPEAAAAIVAEVAGHYLATPGWLDALGARRGLPGVSVDLCDIFERVARGERPLPKVAAPRPVAHDPRQIDLFPVTRAVQEALL